MNCIQLPVITKAWMQNFELKIKEETGIKTLKVGYNKVFGYYIEVSKGQSANVPDILYVSKHL